MLSLRFGTQTETRNLDKSDSAMLSALPPGSSTPLCSHLSGWISLTKATKITLNQSHFKSRFASGQVKTSFCLTQKIPHPLSRALGLCHTPLLQNQIQWSSQLDCDTYSHIFFIWGTNYKRDWKWKIAFCNVFNFLWSRWNITWGGIRWTCWLIGCSCVSLSITTKQSVKWWT